LRLLPLNLFELHKDVVHNKNFFILLPLKRNVTATSNLLSEECRVDITTSSQTFISQCKAKFFMGIFKFKKKIFSPKIILCTLSH